MTKFIFSKSRMKPALSFLQEAAVKGIQDSQKKLEEAAVQATSANPEASENIRQQVSSICNSCRFGFTFHEAGRRASDWDNEPDLEIRCVAPWLHEPIRPKRVQSCNGFVEGSFDPHAFIFSEGPEFPSELRKSLDGLSAAEHLPSKPAEGSKGGKDADQPPKEEKEERSEPSEGGEDPKGAEGSGTKEPKSPEAPKKDDDPKEGEDPKPPKEPELSGEKGGEKKPAEGEKDEKGKKEDDDPALKKEDGIDLKKAQDEEDDFDEDAFMKELEDAENETPVEVKKAVDGEETEGAGSFEDELAALEGEDLQKGFGERKEDPEDEESEEEE